MRNLQDWYKAFIRHNFIARVSLWNVLINQQYVQNFKHENILTYRCDVTVFGFLNNWSRVCIVKRAITQEINKLRYSFLDNDGRIDILTMENVGMIEKDIHKKAFETFCFFCSKAKMCEFFVDLLFYIQKGILAEKYLNGNLYFKLGNL